MYEKLDEYILFLNSSVLGALTHNWNPVFLPGIANLFIGNRYHNFECVRLFTLFDL